jgi:hypothetical protein
MIIVVLLQQTTIKPKPQKTKNNGNSSIYHKQHRNYNNYRDYVNGFNLRSRINY